MNFLNLTGKPIKNVPERYLKNSINKRTFGGFDSKCIPVYYKGKKAILIKSQFKYVVLNDTDYELISDQAVDLSKCKATFIRKKGFSKKFCVPPVAVKLTTLEDSCQSISDLMSTWVGYCKEPSSINIGSSDLDKSLARANTNEGFAAMVFSTLHQDLDSARTAVYKAFAARYPGMLTSNQLSNARGYVWGHLTPDKLASVTLSPSARENLFSWLYEHV